MQQNHRAFYGTNCKILPQKIQMFEEKDSDSIICRSEKSMNLSDFQRNKCIFMNFQIIWYLSNQSQQKDNTYQKINLDEVIFQQPIMKCQILIDVK